MHKLHESGAATFEATSGSPSWLARLGGWCFSHRLAAIGLWLFALVVVFGAAGAVGPAYEDAFDVPGSDSSAGFAVLEEHFAHLGTGGQSGTIVFRAEQGVDDPQVVAAMEELFRVVDAGFPDETGSRNTQAQQSSHLTGPMAAHRSPTMDRWRATWPTRR